MDQYHLLLWTYAVYFICTQNLCKCETCYCLQKKAGNLHHPVFVEQDLNTGNFYVAEQSGIIHVYSKDWRRKPKPFLNLTNHVYISKQPFDERGLLSFALHPQFSSNKVIFVYSIRLINKKEYVVISKIHNEKYSIIENGLLAIEQPHEKRNGGQVLFSREGYLFISVGDGGAYDEKNISHAQSSSSLLGKILRLNISTSDVVNDHIQYYKVPEDNPFVGNKLYRPEIYALGARNMWRCSIDKVTDRLLCGDAGEKEAEEINWIKPGKNYGWNIYEGNKTTFTEDSISIENESPVYSYSHGDMGKAVVGGYVYRGKKFPNLQGLYVFGDYVSGKLFTLDLSEAENKRQARELKMCHKNRCPCNSRDQAGRFLVSFSTDSQDEIYMLTKQNGEILQLIPPLSAVTTCGSVDLTSNIITTLVLTTVVSFCVSKT